MVKYGGVVKINKRTLKKRIRRIMLLCIFTTVILFGGIVILLTVKALKAPAVFASKYVSSSIAQSINSEYFLKDIGIKTIDNFDLTSMAAKDFIKKLNELGKLKNVPPPFDTREMFYILIVVRDKVVFTNENKDMMIFSPNEAETMHDRHFKNPLIQGLYEYYNDTETTYPIIDSTGNAIGRVTARINPEFVLFVLLILVSTIIFIAILSLTIVGIMSKFFTIPIIVPINQLEKKIKAIAREDYETTMNTQIVLKKPLREIQSIAEATNQITQKMKLYNDLLAAQKIELEYKNEELEAQNEELTDSKRQIEDAQNQLIQRENMASIGQLTAAITHEINTPLGAIYSNAQLCEMILSELNENETIKSHEELKDMATQMKEANAVSTMACRRVIEIIKSLKNFSKIDGAEFQESDINEGIISVLVLTSNLWKNKVLIHKDYGILPRIKCFPGLLNQVFMNIIVNAIQSIEDKGDIFIKTYVEESNICISVKDTGSGIKEEYLPRIFDTGFTTKAMEMGMGLGLSLSSDIVKKHNGKIKVNSTLEEGTEFIICLPF